MKKAATRGQANSCKLLDKYDDVNFDAIGIPFRVPWYKTKRSGTNF